MTKERTLVELKLVPVIAPPGLIDARWKRSDGSTGDALVRFRLKAAERWYIAQVTVTRPTTELLRDVPLARIEAAANADPAIRAWLEENALDPETVELARRAAARRPRLKRPAKRRLDDAFYEKVAAAYRGAVANGLSPVKALAVDADTPPGTVSRWIATARDKGYLAEGEQGRVTT